MAAARRVEHFRAAVEAPDRLGDEAAIPGVARRIDPRLARGAHGLAAEALPGVGQRRAREQRAGAGHRAAGEEHVAA